MLDSDLAKLYECKNGTKEINQAVKNNLEKFPERFSWKLDNIETEKLLVKIFDQKKQIETRGGKFKNPRVFTEQGVAMLATILKTPVATQVTINIMDSFVYMRKYISSNMINQKYINNMVLENHEEIKLLKESFNKLNEKQKVNTIFFKGQIFDAYVVLMEILESAKESIIIIDDYAGKELFNLLKNIDKDILVITSNINEVDFNKYTKQYKNIKIMKNDSFHDRFIIIDNKILYHSGASFKDLGTKCFAINLIENKTIINEIIKEINNKKSKL